MKLAKIPIKEIWKTISKSTLKHTPEILTGLGITGMISSTILAVKATPHAQAKIGRAIADKNGDDPSLIETVRIVWKDYLPSAILTVVSTGCLIGATSVSIRRQAALATAYTLSESALSEYSQKVTEEIGEKKERAIREEIAKDKLDSVPYESENVYNTNKGENLCMDSYSGRYFKTNIEDVKQAVNKLNYSLIQQQFISLNDFYYELGLPAVKMGEDLGWPVEKGLIDVTFGAGLVDGKTPCLVLNYTPPINYNTLYR